MQKYSYRFIGFLNREKWNFHRTWIVMKKQQDKCVTDVWLSWYQCDVTYHLHAGPRLDHYVVHKYAYGCLQSCYQPASSWHKHTTLRTWLVRAQCPSALSLSRWLEWNDPRDLVDRKGAITYILYEEGGMQLLIPAWDTCFWHQHLHIASAAFYFNPFDCRTYTGGQSSASYEHYTIRYHDNRASALQGEMLH